MAITPLFLFNSALLGVGLAMDAFTVSAANGLADPYMSRKRHLIIALAFAWFQFLMPIIGWFCVSTVARYFTLFQKAIPWISLILLSWIGGSMVTDGIKARKESGAPSENEDKKGLLTAGTLLLQGIATSIDALSVGFTIADYPFPMALLASLIIGGVTFLLCYLGVNLGKTAGSRLESTASILGGCILLFIGIEIFIRGFFF